MLADGLTVNVYGEEVMPVMVLLVLPALYITVHGAVPDRVIVRLADWPAHITVLPDNAAVGRGFTVTTAVPDVVPVQLASVTDTNE